MMAVEFPGLYENALRNIFFRNSVKNCNLMRLQLSMKPFNWFHSLINSIIFASNTSVKEIP